MLFVCLLLLIYIWFISLYYIYKECSFKLVKTKNILVYLKCLFTCKKYSWKYAFKLVKTSSILAYIRIFI